MKVKGSNGLIAKVLSDRLKGNDLHEARKEFAATSTPNKGELRLGFSSMHTRPYLTRKSIPSSSIIEGLELDYDVLHGMFPGSLFYFVLSLHALGFRLFRKSGEAIDFRFNALLEKENEQLAKALKKSKLEGLDLLNVNAIYSSVTTIFKGKGASTNEDALLARLNQFFTGKSAGLKDSDKLCQALSSELCANFKTWQELNKNPVEASLVFDRVFKKLSISFKVSTAIQRIHNSIAQLPPEIKPATLAYDPKKQVLELSDPASLMLALCSLYGNEVSKTGENPKAHILSSITTQNGNGMSWLFGKGLELIKTHSAKELVDLFGVERTKRSEVAFSELKKAASKIPSLRAMPESSLKGAIPHVQGAIDSFLSNHLARTQGAIKQLNGFEPSFPKLSKLSPDELALLEKSGVDLELYSESASLASQAVKKAPLAYNVMLGRYTDGGDFDYQELNRSKSNIEKYLSLASYLNGTIKSISNHLARELKDGASLDYEELPIPESLPYIGEPLKDPGQDMKDCYSERNRLKKSYLQKVETVVAEYGLSYSKSLAMESSIFKAALKGKKLAINPEQMAARYFLGLLTSAAYRGTSKLQNAVIKVLINSNLCEDREQEKMLREHVVKRQHFMFVHPKDTKPKKLVKLSYESLLSLELIETIDALLKLDLPEKDQVALYMLKGSILFRGLPEKVETKHFFDQTVKESKLRSAALYLEKDVAPRSICLMALNAAYSSKLSGLNYRLNKKSFTSAKTFNAYTKCNIVYVPKSGAWRVPHHYFEGVLGAILSSDSIAWQKEGFLEPEKTIKQITKNFKHFDETQKAQSLSLMKQIPHRWMVDLGIDGWGTQEFCTVINSGGLSPFAKRKGLVPLRFSKKNSVSASAIDRLFYGGSISPSSFLIERSYSVSDNFAVTEDKSKRKAIIYVPTKTIVDPSEERWQPSYLLGVDPSEYGVGLSVVDFKGKLIDSGFVNLGSIINHIDGVRKHKTITSPKQRYKAPYSNHLELSRKAAVGDISNIIDNLLITLNAAPVFEMVEGKASDPFTMIWSQAMQLYTFGENDAQNSTRKSHWYGASKWETNYIREYQTKAKTDLNFFPGTRASSYGNSQTCPECQRNAVSALREDMQKKPETVVIQNSQIELSNGTIAIENPDPETVIKRKKQNLNPQWRPVSDKIVNKPTTNNAEGKSLVTAVRRSIRRPNPSKHAKSGIASVFKCPYTDCEHTGNSDAFAAINVARKLLSSIEPKDVD